MASKEHSAVNDLLTPKWIKEKEAENALNAARHEAARQRQLADSLRIQKDGPDFFQQLLKELAHNTDALPKIGFQGQTVISPTFNPSTEFGCRVFVSIPGNFSKQTHTDILYTKADYAIRCSMINGGVFKFVFYVHEGVVGVLPEIPEG